MSKQTKKRVSRRKMDAGEERVIEAIALVCAQGAETPTIEALARLADVGINRTGSIIARLAKDGTLERVRPGSVKVRWHWRPTGAMTRARGGENDLPAIRAYVRAACAEGRVTPTGGEMARALNLTSPQMAFDRLGKLAQAGELDRRKDKDGMVWVWLPTGEATALRPHGGGCNAEPIRPDRPTAADRAAAQAALERSNDGRVFRAENDPRAARPEPPWRPDVRDWHHRGASASLACAEGW